MRALSSTVRFGIRFAGASGLAATCAVLASACGSRGPLDDDAYLDAGVAADVASVDVFVPDPVDATPADGGRDAGPPSPVECGICLLSECSPAILACVQAPACRNAFQCVITECVGGGGGGGGGGFDPGCLLGCAAEDPGGALQVLQIFQCVTGECGEDCGALLGGLLGGGLPGGGFPGGGGSSGGGGKGGGKEYTPAQRDFAKAFSRWPELAGPIGD